MVDVEGQEDGTDGYEQGVHWSDEVEDVRGHDHGNSTWIGHSTDYDSFYETTIHIHTKEHIKDHIDDHMDGQVQKQTTKQVEEPIDEQVEEIYEGAANPVTGLDGAQLCTEEIMRKFDVMHHIMQ